MDKITERPLWRTDSGGGGGGGSGSWGLRGSEAASGRDSEAEGEQLIPPGPRRCQQEVSTQERNGPIEFQQSKWDN